MCHSFTRAMTINNSREFVLSHAQILCSYYLRAQLNVYFTEVEQSDGPNKYVPRSVQVDLEGGVCNHVSLPCSS